MIKRVTPPIPLTGGAIGISTYYPFSLQLGLHHLFQGIENYDLILNSFLIGDSSSYSSLLDSGKNTHGFLLTIRGDGGGGEAGAACEALAALEAVHGAQEAEGAHEVVAARDAEGLRGAVHEAVVGGGDLEVEEGCAYLVICLISYGLLPS
ncbi:hypothetical protein SAY86_008064 [Trapa natans]|uniref:Uncharacterized protein n=1 Tax=Trapa natans TaxID=22666 RepID=A0AAN7LEF4_TRANT|nr:hypothetical protein SAY86_008064 [Trapa natans]